MKKIEIVMLLFFGIVVPCYGIGDPVSTVTKDDSLETTTFRRDGKTILKIILHQSTEPDRRISRQQVIFQDEVVAEIIDLKGKRVFSIQPKSHLSIVIQQDSKTGTTESVILTNEKNHSLIEIFKVKDSLLTPLSGKQLELNRNIQNDLKGLFQPVIEKKTNPEEFGKNVKDMVEKYQKKDSTPQKDDQSK